MRETKNTMSTSVCLFIICLLLFCSCTQKPDTTIKPVKFLVITHFELEETKGAVESITIPLEKILRKLTIVKHLKSTTTKSSSIIEVSVEAKNKTTAYKQLRQVLLQAEEELPSHVKSIVREKNVRPIYINITGGLNESQLKEHAQTIKKHLSEATFTDMVFLIERPKEMLIQVDALKLSSAQLTLKDVYRAIDNSNVNISAGSISTGSTKNVKIKISNDWDTTSIKETIVKVEKTQITYLKDLLDEKQGFRIVNGPEERVCYVDQKKTMQLAVYPSSSDDDTKFRELVNQVIQEAKEAGKISHSLQYFMNPPVESFVITIEKPAHTPIGKTRDVALMLTQDIQEIIQTLKEEVTRISVVLAKEHPYKAMIHIEFKNKQEGYTNEKVNALKKKIESLVYRQNKYERHRDMELFFQYPEMHTERRFYEVKMSGPQNDTLLMYFTKLKDIINKNTLLEIEQYMIDAQRDVKKTVTINYQKAQQLGISTEDITHTIRARYHGMPTQLSFAYQEESIPVQLSLVQNGKPLTDENIFQNPIYFRSPEDGRLRSVLLNVLATYEITNGFTKITRENSQPVMSLHTATKNRENTSEVITMLQEAIQQLQMSEGYKVEEIKVVHE